MAKFETQERGRVGPFNFAQGKPWAGSGRQESGVDPLFFLAAQLGVAYPRGFHGTGVGDESTLNVKRSTRNVQRGTGGETTETPRQARGDSVGKKSDRSTPTERRGYKDEGRTANEIRGYNAGRPINGLDWCIGSQI